MEVMHPIICQVSSTLPLFIHCTLSEYYPKASVTSSLVSTPNTLGRACLSPCSGLWYHCLCLCFAVDCVSHVRLQCVAAIFLKHNAHGYRQDCYLEQKLDYFYNH